MERLFLNGQEVDVTGDGITFTMKSNLLGEFGKIVAGNSQTVKLPRTVRNMKVLDFPEVVSRSGSMVRRKLAARLERNGVMMIDDGEAVVLSTSEEGYEVGITYGVVSFLSLVKDGGNLNELTDEGEYLAWDKDSLATYPMSVTDYDGNPVSVRDYGYAEYDNGVNDTEKVNVHPCVHLPWLVGKIESRFGFMFAGLGDGLQGKCMLLSEKRQSKTVIDSVIGEYVTNSLIHVTVGSAQTSKSFGIVNVTSVTSPAYKVTYKGGYIKIGQAMSSLRIFASVTGYPSGETLYLLKNKRVYISGGIVAQATVDEYGKYVIEAELTNLKEGDYLCLSFGTYKEATITGGVQISATYVWEEGQEPEEMTYPSGAYPIVPNLPSMKVTDFIQLCGVLTGRFPMVNKGEKDVLRMVSVEDLLGAKGSAVDWSDKWSGEPDSVEYKYLDAVKNYIRWEADEDVEKSGVPTDGYVSVDDDTLEVWNDLIKLPLGASNGGVIPQYSLVDGKLEENSVTERILVLNGETNEVSYTEELWPQTLVSTVLAGYQRLVREPVVIKGTFRLTELDIRGLDYMRPVYLRQLGRYYGIVQVQWKGDESTVELLQLPI